MVKLSGVVEKETVFLLGSKYQGEKSMSFEFTFKSTKFFSLAKHTTPLEPLHININIFQEFPWQGGGRIQ